MSDTREVTVVDVTIMRHAPGTCRHCGRVYELGCKVGHGGERDMSMRCPNCGCPYNEPLPENPYA